MILCVLNSLIEHININISISLLTIFLCPNVEVDHVIGELPVIATTCVKVFVLAHIVDLRFNVTG
jgi:hypothetical protein